MLIYDEAGDPRIVEAESILKLLQEYKCKQWWEESGIEDVILEFLLKEREDD